MTDHPKKKRPVRKAKAPQKTAEPKPADASPQQITFAPIDTDLMRVEFFPDKCTIAYTYKKANEKYERSYRDIHALRIIHGRMTSNPNGEYAWACLAKARVAALKAMPTA